MLYGHIDEESVRLNSGKCLVPQQIQLIVSINVKLLFHSTRVNTKLS